MKKTYTLYEYTEWCILYLIIFTVIGPLVTLNLIEGFEPFSILLFIIIFCTESLIGYFLSIKFGLRRIDISLETDEIVFEIYRFNSKKIKKIRKLLYSKIDRFDDFAFGGDMKFKLFFKSGDSYNIYRSRMWNRKDDFEKLISDFKTIIKNPGLLADIKTTDDPKNNIKITYSDFFNRPIAKILYYISLTILVVITVLLIISLIEIKATTFVVYGALIGYIMTYLSKRKGT